MWSALTRLSGCQHCGQTIHLALCSDGTRRAFDLREYPPGIPGVWAWHRGQGMRETDLAPGYRLRSCGEPAVLLQTGSTCGQAPALG
jgi:hypothetical protein